ncbi:MAG: hypothetical protein ACRCYU_08170 [Nocardioides sp.]
MGWVRVDDAFYDHPKFAAAGPLGTAQWIAALAWSNRNLTDGHIPTAIAKRLLDWDDIPGTADVNAAWVSQRLIDAGLWHQAEGGYLIHDYGDYQPSASTVRAEQAKARDRMARVRARRRATPRHQTSCEPDPATNPGIGSAADVELVETCDDDRFARTPFSGSPELAPNNTLNDDPNNVGVRQGVHPNTDRSSRYPNPKSSTAAAAELARELPPPLRELRSQLNTAQLVVRWDRLTTEQIDQITDLLTIHGPARLVRSAQTQWRRDDPPAWAQAWIAGWQAIPRAVTPSAGKCPRHELEQPCRSCRADELVGAAS